ncbi:alpha/beta fold hydrolase [Crossiella sp. CA198]|uniref:alpha/beta fold hydrolase n=1 Tax=Crossiella sp. CA198 TaxID=3455607 RepID=UPI003F8D2183
MREVEGRTVALPDGRRLGYYEFGDPAGLPCVYSPGWPASGLLGGVYDETARAAGVRWLSVDKPGCGASDFDPRRSLARYAADLACLADHLGLARFAAVGESGGGPHALAMAHALPDRLTSTILLAAIGPGHESQVRQGMRGGNRWLFLLAQHAPWLLRLQLGGLSRLVRDPAGARRFEQSMLRRASPADRAALHGVDTGWLAGAAAGALRDGGRAAAQELVMIARPWGFALSEITAPVLAWHGDQDTNVPLPVARRLADTLPDCTLRVIQGQAHGVGLVVRDEVMAAIRAAG